MDFATIHSIKGVWFIRGMAQLKEPKATFPAGAVVARSNEPSPLHGGSPEMYILGI